MDEIRQRKVDVQKEAVNSAAMQDHLMKKFKVGNIDPFKPTVSRKPPGNRVGSGSNSLQGAGLQVLGVVSSINARTGSANGGSRDQKPKDVEAVLALGKK